MKDEKDRTIFKYECYIQIAEIAYEHYDTLGKEDYEDLIRCLNELRPVLEGFGRKLTLTKPVVLKDREEREERERFQGFVDLIKRVENETNKRRRNEMIEEK